MGEASRLRLVHPRTPAECGRCGIRSRTICAACGAEELAALDRITSRRTYSHGRTIVATGEEMPFVGSVATGIVSLKRTMADGRRQMVGLLFPGDFLGRPDRAVAHEDVAAVGDVTLCAFERRGFARIMSDFPALEQRLLQMALEELDAAREWMLLLGRKSAEERVASFIAFAGLRLGARLADGEAFELPLGRADMAEYLGLTLETASRQVGRLKKAGLIEMKGSRNLAVRDYAALLALAGNEPEGGFG